MAAKDARLREIEGAVAGAERERVTSEARLQEAERVVVNAAQELAARDQRLAEMEQVLADRTRNSEDTESYVRHLEAELRKRTGDIAIRDDEMSVLRTHIERAEKTIRARDQDIVDRDAIVSELRIHIQRAENTISARDREIVDRDAVLGVLRAKLDDATRSIEDREALLRISQGEVAENQQLASHTSWVLQHPRHRLADQSANALMRWMPLLHRLLRTLIVPALHDSPAPSGSPRTVALIEFVEVTLPPLDEGRLWGRHLDYPISGSIAEAAAVEIRGWVVGRDSPRWPSKLSTTIG